jgi:hypothetical protein
MAPSWGLAGTQRGRLMVPGLIQAGKPLWSGLAPQRNAH